MSDGGSPDAMVGAPISEDEFRQLLEAEIPRLRRVAGRIAPIGTDPDDLTHDALERAWRNRTGFRGDAAMSSWLYRIVTNRAADLAQRRVAVPVEVSENCEGRVVGLEVSDPAALLDAVSDGEQVRAALSGLAPVDRALLVLHDGEGMAVPQIAEACGLSTVAAHKRLQRARARFVQAILAPANLPPATDSPFCFECREFAADYLNDDLDEQRRLAIEAHLRVCTNCPPLAQAAIGLREVLDRARSTTVHDQVTGALRADLRP